MSDTVLHLYAVLLLHPSLQMLFYAGLVLFYKQTGHNDLVVSWFTDTPTEYLAWILPPHDTYVQRVECDTYCEVRFSDLNYGPGMVFELVVVDASLSGTQRGTLQAKMRDVASESQKLYILTTTHLDAIHFYSYNVI